MPIYAFYNDLSAPTISYGAMFSKRRFPKRLHRFAYHMRSKLIERSILRQVFLRHDA